MPEGADAEPKDGSPGGASPPEADDLGPKRLKVDLAASVGQQERADRDKLDFEEIRRMVLEDENGPAPQLRTRVDLGSGTYAQAVAPDAEKVFVNVGLGFHVECEWQDAERIAQLKREALDARANEGEGEARGGGGTVCDGEK
ncbi:unnamed protein product [Ostreobium quekettii]|uniref:Uncharacterized protein n=1 Tax=Ostreobium quekettii TaxID=121088 RepID=A0A8S1IU92_9CHLO|nr:unnamed protein product [Ostreobium quekettii]|eukprot:evm.model.scf_608.5 EVM.evm.TU.scf_608.5   scf_608:31003-31431(-)